MNLHNETFEYDPDTAQAAAELWDFLEDWDGEGSDAQLVIQKVIAHEKQNAVTQNDRLWKRNEQLHSEAGVFRALVAVALPYLQQHQDIAGGQSSRLRATIRSCEFELAQKPDLP